MSNDSRVCETGLVCALCHCERLDVWFAGDCLCGTAYISGRLMMKHCPRENPGAGEQQATDTLIYKGKQR